MMNVSFIRPNCLHLLIFGFIFVLLAAWAALCPRVSGNRRVTVRDSWSQTPQLVPARQNVDAQGGRKKKNQINNSRPGRFNVDTMMTKDKQGCGQQWRTQPPALPSSVNCCLATGFTLTGLQAAVCCLWPHLGGNAVCYKSRAILATVAMHSCILERSLTTDLLTPFKPFCTSDDIIN